VLAACGLLVFHGILWLQIARLRPLRLPATPADLTNPVYAQQWQFLMDARGWVPQDAPYTVVSDDPEREMSLFMLSLAVYPKARALPTSYFGPRPANLPAEARFGLDENCRLRDRPDLRVLATLSAGCVETRR
jgi:hypothetical protein